MAVNRRNVLVAMGAALGGGGLLMATGAFSTVSAERDVSVSTAGDGSAYLTLVGDSDYVVDDGDDTLAINLSGTGSNGASGFNENAITTISDIVTITNNAADGSQTTVGVSPDSPSQNPSAGSEATLTIDVGTDEFVDVTFYVDDSNTNGVGSGSTSTLSTGSSAYLDVKIDTTSMDRDPSSVTTDSTLTIVAN